jgi:hypothetical protein
MLLCVREMMEWQRQKLLTAVDCYNLTSYINTLSESRKVKLKLDEHAYPILIFSEHMQDLDKMWGACVVHIRSSRLESLLAFFRL